MKRLLALLASILFFPIFVFSQGEISQFLKGETAGGTIRVTIGGTFVTNGTFSASVEERVDQFITRLYNNSKAQYLSVLKDPNLLPNYDLEFGNYAKRNIILKRFDGTKIPIDLMKFRTCGDFKYNPYLKNDDFIFFPDLNLETNFVSIDGAVNFPTKIQFVEGDKLSDLIEFAHGLNDSYEKISEALITRISYNGEKEEQIKVRIDENPLLKRGDRIAILAEESQKKDYKIMILGEVLRPGNIPITKNNTLLKDAIKKAGGVRENADLNRAEIIRGANNLKSVFFNENYEQLLMTRMSYIPQADSLTLLIDNKLRFSRSNGVVDFEKMLYDSTSEDSKFVVKDGDLIFIPEKSNLVYVHGQVMNPGYVSFKEGKDFMYYINQAGGISMTAKEEYFLIKGKSRAWVELKEDKYEKIESGDFIWIPKKPYLDFSYYLQRVSSIASVVGALATLVLIFIQVGK